MMLKEMMQDEYKRGYEQGNEQGIERGKKQGIEQGKKELSAMYDWLCSNNRIEDVKKVSSDPVYRDKVFEEYSNIAGISKNE